MRKAGRPLHPDDDAPELSWERAVWWLYTKVQTQWRAGMNGRDSLDYNPAISLIKELRWSVVGTLDLLQVIELEFLECQREQRQSSQG